MADFPDLQATDFGAAARASELLAALGQATGVIERRWSFRTGQKVRAVSTDLGVADSRGRILVGSEDCSAYALTTDGALLWTVSVGGWVMGVDFAQFGPGAETLAVVGADQLYLIDSSGSVVERVSTAASVTSLCVCELRGQMAVISGHEDGSLQAYDPQRGVFWRARTPKRVVSLACCDVDFDGRIEVAAASEDRNVYIFDDSAAELDRLQSNHWIISLAVGDVYGDGTRRLLVAGFDGEAYVYGGGKSAALRVNRQGILSVSMGSLIPGFRGEHLVVGSSDQRVSIFDQGGRELWRFSTSYGHRVVHVLESDGEPSLLVGAQDGMVHCVAIRLVDGLRERIESGLKLLIKAGTPLPPMDSARAAIVTDLVEYEKEPTIFSRARVRECTENGSFADAAQELVGLWSSGVEEAWHFPTEGRIYDLCVSPPEWSGCRLILGGSGDGSAYALDIETGETVWCFHADGPVRGVSWISDDPSLGPGALVGSVDGAVYRLDMAGKPMWHRQTPDWVLFTEVNPLVESEEWPRGWFGSEARYIEAVDRWGSSLWQIPTEDRVRALGVGDVDGDGLLELIGGSDDQYIYVADAVTGKIKNRFEAPHWVLAVAVAYLPSPAKPLILVGTEDGSLYAYEATGKLQWSFATGHWVAGIDTRRTAPHPTEQIVVGSADHFLYGLSTGGELRWAWQTGARVRTVADCGADSAGDGLVAYGSYDRGIHMLRLLGTRSCVALADQIISGARGTPLPTTSAEIEALTGLSRRDAGLAFAALRSDARLAAKAISAAVLLSTPQQDFATPGLVAQFLGNEASEQHFMAVMRTLAELEPDPGIIEVASAELIRLGTNDRFRARAQSLRRISEW